MTLILSGTDGVSDIDGTAATPAIRGTDANTGIFFPAADTIAFAEGGTEAMRIDSSGNVLIGTTSASGFDSAADNLIVGGGSGSTGMTIYSGTAGVGSINFADGTTGSAIYAGGINYNHNTNLLALYTNDGSTRMAIDSSGNVKLSTAGTSVLNSSGNKILNQTGSVLQVVSTTSSTVVTNTGTVSSLLSTSITPSSTSNKILILTSLTCVMNANTNALGGSSIYRGTTSGTLLQVLYSGNNSTPGCYGAFSHSFLDSPSTTSSQTYTLGINRGSGGTTSQVTEGTYSLILMEIAA